MDEPLGALDRKLREALQVEIMQVSREIGATVLYVTHDQEEALVMSDRIAIFSRGRIEQLGSGEDLYERPTSLFVADFIGTSNILRGRFEQNGDAGGWLTGPSSRLRVSPGAAERASLDGGVAAALVVRPERTRILDPDEPPPPDANVRGRDGRRGALPRIGERSTGFASPTGRRPPSASRALARDGQWEHGDAVRVAWAVDDGVLLADPG